MSTAASSTSYQGAFASRLAGAVPPLLFGLRVATAVSLALFAAFYLQLETPSWAGTSACVVCQPILGSSLLKGVARMVGTVIGALASMVLTAIFPQDRAAFLFAMLLWLSICSFVAALLRNFAAYAALLAGFTLAIIAGTSIPAPDQIFDIAVGRASEICVGIVCGTLVMALTDLGNSPRRLAVLFSQLITDTAANLAGILAQAGSPHADLSDQRRALIARTTALDPVIGAAAGESPELLQRRATLRAAMNGLFRALAGARIVETHLRSLPSAEARHTAGVFQDQLPPDWAAQHGRAQTALDRDGDVSVVRRLLALGTNDDLSMRLTADATANVAIGLAIAANGLTLLEDPAAARDVKRPFSLFVADWLPALINALRTFLGVGVTVMFWIITAWPNGLLAITFTAITIMAFAPVPGSKMTALGQGLGSLLTAIAVAIIKFALLPNHESFLAFSLIIAVALVPLGALSTVPVLAPYLLPAMINFIPLLTPTNQISYDLEGYLNTAPSLLTGCLFGIVTLVLFPPVSSSIRSQRLVDLSIRDFRRLATGRRRWTRSQWQNRIYTRLAAMPEDSEPVQRSYLASALSLGTEVIRLKLRSRHCGIEIELPAALARLGNGDLSELRSALGTIDLAVSSIPPDRPGALARLRARSTLLSIREVVDRHREYFESRPS